MRPSCFPALSMVFLLIGSADVIRSNAGADEKLKKEPVAKGDAPPKYLRAHIWYMKYKADKQWVYMAGYCDPERERVYYRWKGVQLEAEQVPGLFRLTNRTPIYDINKVKGLKQVEIDPPVRYWLLKSGRYAVGYFDVAELKFFRWRDITLEAGELLANQEGYPPRIVPAPRLDLEGKPYSTDKENDFLVTIDPPAHLAKQPKLFKKN